MNLIQKLWKSLAILRFLLFQRHRHNTVILEKMGASKILVLPGVLNPNLTRSGSLFSAFLNENLIPHGTEILDIGTGSGILAVKAATWAKRVVGVDSNPAAIRCATINALIHKLEDRVEFIKSDLFSAIPDQKFDVILFNPPFYIGEPKDHFDQAWRSVDVVERFSHQCQHHLKPGGYALVILSTYGESKSFLKCFNDCFLKVTPLQHFNLIQEILTIYKLEPHDHSL